MTCAAKKDKLPRYLQPTPKFPTQTQSAVYEKENHSYKSKASHYEVGEFIIVSCDLLVSRLCLGIHGMVRSRL